LVANVPTFKAKPPCTTIPYQPGPTKLYDLLHTKLEVSLDWERQQLQGVATIQLRPHFYPQQQLVLDAHYFDIHQVSLLDNDKKGVLYTYNDHQLTIQLDRPYTREETLTLEISYTTRSKPHKHKQQLDSEQGIYFIQGNDMHHIPQQAWTQGEPNTSSYWFPTIDAPNQRLTQEVYITVEDRFKTLSNGILVYSTLNDDLTRTDYWRMELPHAPYLFMLAVGDFVEVEDEWSDIPISYYIAPNYAPYAKMIFEHTTEMLDFFSEKLDYPFPWPKYSQMIVRDYIAGAMENTTAVLFTEAIQGDERTLLDKPDRARIIAHELFHHWFGNLITCNSWGQLALQEALAEWGAHFWYEHQYGAHERDRLIDESIQGYLEEFKTKQVSVIRDHYQTPMEMFDKHTYSKGSLILHMLEAYIGQEAFLESLSQYLKRHAFSATDIHQLRKTFEDITGQDLNWFFNQWFLAPGHPLLQAEHTYTEGKLTLKIWQKQGNSAPVYQLPLAVDIWVKGKKERHMIKLSQAYEEFSWPVTHTPEVVYIDKNYLLVGEIDHFQSNQAYQKLYNYAADYWAKQAAIQHFSNRKADMAAYYNFFQGVLEDNHWGFQVMAMEIFKGYKQADKNCPTVAKIEEKLLALIQSSHPRVRAQALETLSSLQTAGKHIPTYKNCLQDPSYHVASKALYAYAINNLEEPSTTKDILSSFEAYDNIEIVEKLAAYYTNTKQADKYEWLYHKTRSLYTQYGYAHLLSCLAKYATVVGTPQQQESTRLLLEEILHQKGIHQSIRLAAYKATQFLPANKAIKQLLSEIKVHE
jgi:aminopeptidase N